MSALSYLSPEETQILNKIFCQYITSKTSTALSTLLSEPINHNVNILNNGVTQIKNIKHDAGEIKVCAVRLNGKGDTHIEILYTMNQEHAKKIAAKLLCQNDICEIDEMGISAIQEVANIMTGSFFNALSHGTGFRVDLSTPNYANTELSSLVDNLARDVTNATDYAVVADVELVGQVSGTKLHMIIMQNSDDARKLLANHSDKSDESNIENSELPVLAQETTMPYTIGSCNTELDALLGDMLKGEQ
jgi:chemotaxis protein CheC